MSHNVSEVVENNQRLLSQSKSTGKVAQSERAAEMPHAGSHTSPLGQTVQIDDGKLKHYQQMIQNVKFSTNEMHVSSDLQADGQDVSIAAASGPGRTEPPTSEAAHAYDYAGMEAKPKQ